MTVLCHHPFGKVLEFSKTAYQLTSEGLCQSGKLMVNPCEFMTCLKNTRVEYRIFGRGPLVVNLAAAILRRSLEGDKVAQDIRTGDGHFFRDFWPLLQFSWLFSCFGWGNPSIILSYFNHLRRPGRGGKDAD